MFGRHQDGILKNKDKTDKIFKGILKAVNVEWVKEDNGGSHRNYQFIIQKHFSKYTYTLRGEPSHDLQSYYHIGEPVMHIEGYPVPIRLNRKNNERQICVECGELISFGKRQCQFCGKGIV